MGTVLIVSVLIGLPLAFAQNDDFVVIVHIDNQTTALSKSEVSGYFLKKVTRWAESREVAQPVDQVANAALRESFSAEIHGRSVDRIKSYWQRRIFSGRDVPPPELSNDSEVLAFVNRNPGGIGYVSTTAALTGVKAIAVPK